MKRFAVFAFASFFTASLSLTAAAQTPVLLEGDQAVKGKEISDKYKEEKSELELQLKKLEKDRDIAKRDQNTALVNKRNGDIAETKQKIKNLSIQYNKDFSDILTDDQKKDVNMKDSDFYAKELAAEEAKMNGAEDAKKQKKPEKKGAKKKNQPKKDDEIVIPNDGDTVGDFSEEFGDSSQKQPEQREPEKKAPAKKKPAPKKHAPKKDEAPAVPGSENTGGNSDENSGGNAQE